jgi:hypothetical protein
MPMPARSPVATASHTSAGSAATTRSGVGPPANSSTSTRCVASNPNAANTPDTTVASATISVRVRSARQLIATAMATSRGSCPNTANGPASERAFMPVSHHVVRNSGNTACVELTAFPPLSVAHYCDERPMDAPATTRVRTALTFA